MRIVFIFLCTSFSCFALFAQESATYLLFPILKHLQNPAAYAQQEKPILTATYGNYGLASNKNYLLTYEQPSKKRKSGFGGSYFLEQNYYARFQQFSLAYNYGRSINKESFLRIGLQVSGMLSNRFFSRIPRPAFSPVTIDPRIPTTDESDQAYDLDFGIWFQHKNLDIGLSYRHVLSPFFNYKEYQVIHAKPTYFLYTSYLIEISSEFSILAATNHIIGGKPNYFTDISGTLQVQDTYFVSFNIRPISVSDFAHFGVGAGLKFWKIRSHFYYMPKTNDSFGTVMQFLVRYEF